MGIKASSILNKSSLQPYSSAHRCGASRWTCGVRNSV